MALFIATRGASHPWLTVPTIPDRELPPAILRTVRLVRSTLRSNAATIGEPCRLRAVVVTGREVGGSHVAIVTSSDGRIARVFPGVDLWQSAAVAATESRAAERRAAERAAERAAYLSTVCELDALTAEHGAPGAPRALFTREA